MRAPSRRRPPFPVAPVLAVALAAALVSALAAREPSGSDGPSGSPERSPGALAGPTEPTRSEPATAALDLGGPLEVTSTLDGMPFSAAGWATLGHAGGAGSETWYVTGGTLTLAEPVAYGGGACTAASPVSALRPGVARLDAGASRLELGFSAHWDLACTGGPASAAVAAFAFDTIGVAHPTCARTWVGRPTIGPGAVAGTFQVDCGARGWLEATWNLAAP